MSEIRQQADAAVPRQRGSGGVMGYVAELQQLDSDSAGGRADHRPELPPGLTLELELVSLRGRRAPAQPPAATPDGSPQRADEHPADEHVADGQEAGPGEASPVRAQAVPPVVRLAEHMSLAEPMVPGVRPAPAVPAQGGSPVAERRLDPPSVPLAPDSPFPPAPGIRPDAVTRQVGATAPAGGDDTAGRGGRGRLLLLGVASAVLAGIAVAYAGLYPPSSSTTTTAPPPPQVEAPAVTPPVDADLGGTQPKGTPAATPSAASASSSAPAGPGDAVASPSASASTPGGTQAGGPAGAGDPVPAVPTRPARPTGEPSASVPPVQQAPVPPPGAELQATFTRTANVLPLGLGGYVGTVRLANPGSTDTTGWRVRLTVPGGNQVVPGEGVVVVQNGEQVFFRPRPGLATVPAGGAVSFTFTVNGVLAAEPAGCTVDGNPCG